MPKNIMYTYTYLCMYIIFFHSYVHTLEKDSFPVGWKRNEQFRFTMHEQSRAILVTFTHLPFKVYPSTPNAEHTALQLIPCSTSGSVQLHSGSPMGGITESAIFKFPSKIWWESTVLSSSLAVELLIRKKYNWKFVNECLDKHFSLCRSIHCWHCFLQVFLGLCT